MVSRYFYCKCDDVAYTSFVERVVALQVRLFLGGFKFGFPSKVVRLVWRFGLSQYYGRVTL